MLLRPRALQRTLLATVVAALVAPSLSPAASATEILPRPSDGVLTLAGKGFGHGRGLSQHGARGAAIQGLTYSQIVGFYYPGTTLADAGDPTVRVSLQGDTDNEARLLHVAGMTAQADGRPAATLPSTSGLGGPLTLWRVVRDSLGLRLQGFDASAGVWLAHDVTGTGAATTQITLTSPVGLTRLGDPARNRFTEYRGSIRAVPSGSAPGLRTLAVLPLEQYLRGVVPAEMPASWPAEALAAQAVAARTYARWEVGVNFSRSYDTCDTTSCQVFKGTAEYAGDGVTRIASFEDARSDSAIARSARQTLLYNGATAFTQFSASNGGYSVAGSVPYLTARPDPYDGVVPGDANAWMRTVSASTLESAYPSIGRFLALVVEARDGGGEWGGRTTRVTLRGSSASVTVSADSLRASLGLRSNWWTVTDSTRRVTDVDGDGISDLLGRVAGSGELLLYPGDGGGGLDAPRTIGTGWGTFNLLVAPGDWDGDTVVDLLARDMSGRMWLYPGDGRGSWKTWRVVNSGWGALDLIVGAGDWDGDGLNDVLAREAGTGRLLLYCGDGAGGFRSTSVVGSGWQTFDALVAVGDWDGDGAGDLLAREASTGILWLYPGDGRGSWKTWRVVGSGWSRFDLVVGRGDSDGDGLNDVLARDAESGDLWLYPGDGRGGWKAWRVVNRGWQLLDAVP